MIALLKKLNLKHGTPITLLNAPAEFAAELEKVEGVEVRRETVVGVRDVAFALTFAVTQSELDDLSRQLIDASIEGDVILWFAYPKGSSRRYQCEFNRDSGWSVLGDAGFEPVRQVAVDADWSALRFRRVAHIQRLTRDPSWMLSAEGKARRSVTETDPSRTAETRGTE